MKPFVKIALDKLDETLCRLRAGSALTPGDGDLAGGFAGTKGKISASPGAIGDGGHFGNHGDADSQSDKLQKRQNLRASLVMQMCPIGSA